MNKATIRELCPDMHSGGTPSTKCPEYWNGSLPWLSSAESGNDYINHATQYITQAGVENSSTRYAEKDSVIIATAGEGKTRGQVSYLDIGAYINQSLITMKTDETEVLTKYLYYYLKNSYKRLRALSDITGVRGSLSGSLLGEFEISYPNLYTQSSIVSFLTNIDDLIKNNTAALTCLESIAKLIYDFWFVQFDFPDEDGKPYKSSGGKMVWNERLKREVPDGWSDNCVGELIRPIQRGISYSSEDILSANGMPFLNLACFNKQGEYRSGEMKSYSGEYSESDKVFPFDMLIACTDMTQGADIIGRPILVTKESDFFLYSMDLAKITPSSIEKMYLYYTLKTSFYHHYIKPFASGTNVKHLDTRGIIDYKMAVPPKKDQERFESIVLPIKQRQMGLLNEISLLSEFRTWILPLLLNGQISICDVN